MAEINVGAPVCLTSKGKKDCNQDELAGGLVMTSLLFFFDHLHQNARETDQYSIYKCCEMWGKGGIIILKNWIGNCTYNRYGILSFVVFL